MDTSTITDLQKVTFNVQFFDGAPTPNAVPVSALASVVWTTSDSTLLTLTPSDDGASCTCTRVGPLGSAQVTVTGTNQDGSQVIGVQQVDVVASDAVTANISAGTPEPA